MKFINKLKSKVHAIIFWQTNIGELLNNIYDLRLFLKYRFTERKLKSKTNYQAFLTKQYHIIEKGLALPESRKAFGKPKIKLLIYKSLEYLDKFGYDILISNIQGSLKQYLDRNNELKIEDLDFYNFISEFLINSNTESNGGVKMINLNELKQCINIDYEGFVKSRTSVRNFSKEDILDSEIIKAVEIARFTPSVCNRQSWKVYYFKDEIIKKRLLNLQGGNNGFTDSINKLLIIATDVRRFTKLESNQIYTDGGLFAMNLLLSLHSQGIGSCCLNTCVPFTVEKEIKLIARIPDSEKLIMMIGIGKFKLDFEVAISNKLLPEEIIVFN
jgi:nitroreductase